MAALSAQVLGDLTREFKAPNVTWAERKPILRTIVEKGSTADLETFLGGVAQATGNTVPTQVQKHVVNSEQKQSLRYDVNSNPIQPEGAGVNIESTEDVEAVVNIQPTGAHQPGVTSVVNEAAGPEGSFSSVLTTKKSRKGLATVKGFFRERVFDHVSKIFNKVRGKKKTNLEPAENAADDVHSTQEAAERHDVNRAKTARPSVSIEPTKHEEDNDSSRSNCAGEVDLDNADQDEEDNDQLPPLPILVNELLYFAAEIGKPDMLKFLVETKGADVNWAQGEEWGTPYYAGWDYFDLIPPEMQQDDNFCCFDQSALMVAAKKANIQCVKLLLDAKADTSQSDRTGTTALMWAAHTGSPQCVKLLLEAGADVNQADMCIQTPLQCSAYNGNAYYQQRLSDLQADGNESQHVLNKPFPPGEEKVKVECTKLLLEAGADVNLAEDGEPTPLMMAAWDSASDCVKLLLETGAHVNKADKSGETSLMKAVWHNASDCVKLLLGAGADVDQADQHGEMALMKAARKFSTDCVKLLLEAGADVNLGDKNGQTSLMKAAWQNASECVKLLLCAGADVNLTDRNGYTPLSSASYQNASDCMKLLMDAGAEVNHADNDGRTSLMKAAFQNASDCLKLLMEKGADVNQCDRGGRAALFNAAWQGADICSKNLLDAGADVNLVDEYGKTALIAAARQAADDEAIQVKQQDVVLRLLLAAGAEVNVPCNNKPNCRESGAKLLFAAGEEHIMVQPDGNQQAKQFFPEYWNEQKLKNECRKVIRKHLLNLDPHTNLFMRIPQLQMTTKRAGLPDYVVFYLLFHENIETHVEELDISGLTLDA